MPAIPRKPRRETEAALLRAIMLALGGEPDVLVLRNSVGRAVHVGANGREWTVPYGLGVGSPDLLLFTSGRAWALEVKRPGEHPTPEQSACHARWARHGVVVTVVRSVADAREALTRAREGR